MRRLRQIDQEDNQKRQAITSENSKVDRLQDVLQNLLPGTLASSRITSLRSD